MCVFRVSGKAFDPDAFAARTRMPVVHSFHAGEPRVPRSRGVRPAGGVTIDVSERPWEALGPQIEDALAFLRAHGPEIAALRADPAVETLSLDFPLDSRIASGDTLTQFEYLPAELVTAAGALGIGLALSIYPAGWFDGDDPDDDGHRDIAGRDRAAALLADMTTLRPWRADDLASLVANANDRNVSRTLRDVFPHPYTEDHGRHWLARATAETLPTALAIQCDGVAIGGASVHVGTDVERVSAEIGYWLGEPHWGRGIGTAAVRELVGYAFALFPINRVWAGAFSHNEASIALLEGLGFRREGELRDAIVKDGQLLTQTIYAVTRAEWGG
jgi:ribosomal-protein-alanine N-acetyltransferase